MKTNINVLNQIIKNYGFGSATTGTEAIPQGNNQTSIVANIDKFVDNETNEIKYVIVFRYNSIVIDDKAYDVNTFIRSLDDTADVYIKAYIQKIRDSYKKNIKGKLMLEPNRIEDGHLEILNRLDGVRTYYYYVKKYIYNIK